MSVYTLCPAAGNARHCVFAVLRQEERTQQEGQGGQGRSGRILVPLLKNLPGQPFRESALRSGAHGAPPGPLPSLAPPPTAPALLMACRLRNRRQPRGAIFHRQMEGKIPRTAFQRWYRRVWPNLMVQVSPPFAGITGNTGCPETLVAVPPEKSFAGAPNMAPAQGISTV